jgi:CheY-like chemotaxis protein
MKVLIADDQPEFVSSIVNEIRRAGFVSESVPDADSALLRIRERVYDLILTDLQMPPGNWGGLEFIKTARLIDPLAGC